jgi:hypothetical protein
MLAIQAVKLRLPAKTMLCLARQGALAAPYVGVQEV